ncbi:MAG: 30S ribosome-binding factor RbfA [Dehalococcoidales bacterium]|nr:30S ribosome-binding factor RbfA [Dehalococcoidales bacterium]
MSHRIERVNSLIRQTISEMLQYQVKDPRLSNLITVTEVITSSDLKNAKVFISHIGNEEEKEELLKGLSSAAGFFRRELSKHLRLRHTPVLSFHWDDSIKRGEHLLQLIEGISQGENDPD